MIYFLRFDRYVAVSKSTQNQLIDIGVKKEKTQVVYNGVDYEHWNPSKYDGGKTRKKLGIGKEFVYFFSGRPGVSKGLEYLIKAVPIISKKIPKSKLLAIVSKDKQYRGRYRYVVRLIKKLKIEDKVIIHDAVNHKELPNYVKAADCVVVPSLAEGFGFAAAEACAMKKPVVVSNTTSLPEVVSGKYVIVEPRSPAAIAVGVEKVFKNKVKDKSLKRFLLKDNIKNYLRVYKEILKG
jgi:glycosyltransferase involved in cell wall biosynthesis